MKRKLEFYPEKRGDDIKFYLEFSQWEGKPESWQLFQRHFILPPADFNKLPVEEQVMHQMTREGHPYNLGEGIVAPKEVVDMNTRQFLCFMVDALNASSKKA